MFLMLRTLRIFLAPEQPHSLWPGLAGASMGPCPTAAWNSSPVGTLHSGAPEKLTPASGAVPTKAGGMSLSSEGLATVYT